MQTTQEGRDLFAEAGIKPSTAGRFVPDEESGSHGRFVPDKPEKPVGEPSKTMTRPERGVLNMIADLGLSVWEGAKGTARSIGAAGNTVSGDFKDVERAAADQRAASETGPQAKRDLLDEIERRKKADTAPGLVSAVKNVGGTMIDNPEGTAQFVAEQAPNSAVSLGAGWAGAKGGALAGSAFGPVGTAVGGIGGFLGGMFLGNWLLETGSKAMDKAEGGFTQAERGEALLEGATKGAVITGVDALTLGVGGKVAKGLNKAAIEAGARAEARVLADAGVDLASRAAIEKALAEPALREAAKAAGQQAAKQAASIKSKAATAGAGIAMETVGEGTGEYLGELAATGKADVYDAVMEAAAGMTQSGPETAWNMRRASGNDLDSRGIARAGAQAEPTGSPVAGGITNPALDANQAGQRITAERAMDQQRAAESAIPKDPASTGPQKRPQERLAELEIQSQTMGLTPALVSEKQAILEGMQAERADAPQQGIDQPQAANQPEAVGQVSAADPATAQQSAPITNFWTYAKSKGYAPGQLRVGTPEHAAVKAEFDAQKTAPAAQRASILPTVATDQTSTAPANSATPAMGQDLSLQNRDRSRTASVVQMQDIANRPDYMRLGPSRSPDAGAPMVFAVADDISMHVPEGNEGRVDVAVMADGQRVPFRYAVVEASSVQPSNLADGSPNPLFMDTEPGTLKALNNGRTAGLRAAYERGTAENYRQELIADAAAHGVPVEAIARTPNPILVRVYSEASNTPDMATKSQGQGLGMSPGELARQDAPLIDASVLAVYQSADVTSAANRDFVRAFVGKLLAAGQDVAPLMTAEGTLSPAGRTRIQAALMQAAYGDADLVQELFDSLDTDIKSIGETLKAVAGEWANMRDSARTGAINPDADITGNLLQAIALIRQSRRDHQALTEIISQPDLMTGEVPDSLTVGLLRMFHTGPNLSRAAGRDRVAQDLRNYLGMAMATSAEPDMFGQTVAPFTIVQELTTSGDSNDKTATQESQGQPGSRPDAGGRAQAAGSTIPGSVNEGYGPATGGNRPAEPETAAGPTGSSDAQAAQGDDPAQFQLSAPTPQVLRDIDASITAIEQQLAAQRQQEEQRAQADAERDSFTLTGSDRAADVAAARGQQDIFSSPKTDAPQPRNPAAPGESRIEDVGQQLYANRRNFTGRGLKWADLEGLNDTLKLKEVTKAKVWPRPNYEQLVADGMSPLLARMVKQVYDGLSAGPTIRAGTPPTDEHLKRYIETLGKIREGLFAFVNDRQAVAEFAGAVLAQVKGRQAVTGPVAITDMLSQNVDAKAVSEALIRRVWPEQYQGSMRAFARGSQAHADVAIIGGNKALGALQFVRQDFAKWAADLDKNWPTKREAWQVQGWRVLGPDEYTALGQEQPDGSGRMSIRLKQGRGSWRADFTIEQLTKPTYLLVQEGGFTATTFETREAAIEAARAKVKRDASIGQDIRGTNIEDAERTGPARREEGEDISAQGLMDAFGFRGVNFGREGWIKQAERQAYLNQAYDGLLDLAEVLGVPPKAMSLNGELGIAFGAQGKGKFAAHFVPGVNEINLTKTRGAGTLAHEWGHALDHYFGKQAGLAKDAEPFLSEHAYKGDKTDRMTFEGGRYVSQKGMATFGPEIRTEIVQAFRTIYQAMMKRAESVGESKTRRDHAKEQATKRLDRWIKSARRVLEGSAADNKADLLAEFDQHAEKLMQGDTGDGFEQAGKQVFSARVAAVRNLIKDATGRTWSLDETNGLESSARYVRNLLAKSESDDAHEPQLVGTQYKGDSAAMDRAKGGKAYWSTPTEMFARAFELFVHDRLSQAGARNTFLTDAEQRASKPAQVADTSSAMARASGGTRDLYLYPVGKERETLREAFDNLVNAIETRETEQGVALFNRQDDAYTDANGQARTQPDEQDRTDIAALEAIHDDGNRRAIDAGRVRSARAVHPYRWVRLPDISALGAIARAFGTRVVGFEVASKVLTKEFGFFNGVTRPGSDNRIFLNASSDRPHLAILGHEVAHQLARRRPDLYAQLVDAIRPYVKAKEYGTQFAGSAVARDAYAPGASAEIRDAAIREEFIGEVLSDGFMDQGFWRALGQKNPSLMQALANLVNQLIDTIKAAVGYTRRTERYLIDFDQVMQVAGSVMAEYGLLVQPSLGQDRNRPTFDRSDSQIQTKAFRDWFGSSRVVDSSGDPLVVYHATTKDFSEFRKGKGIDVINGGAQKKLGFFFSDSLNYVTGYMSHPDIADAYADEARLMPVYLALQNPKIESIDKIADIEESWSTERGQRYRRNLEKQGYDGIIFVNDSGDTVTREYVAFRPEQIKSAIGNIGTFDPYNPDVRFNRNTIGNQPPAQIPPEQQNAWTKAKAAAAKLTSPEAINKLIYEFQDKYIDLKNLREHIKAIGGTITDLNDAYLGEELFHKRLGKRTEDFLDKELRPLMAEMRANGVSLAEFEKYLHARHAPEANRVLAERNPNRDMIEEGRDKAKATVRDLEIQLQRATANGSATKALTEALEQAKQEAATWHGAQSFRGDEAARLALSGMSDDDAKAYMDSLAPRKRAHIQALAAKVDAIQAKTLDTLEDYGLMDKATLNAWRKTYQHYVPLHRDEAHADSDRHPTGQGFSVKGEAAKRRVGSGESVTNILAHIAMQREAALTRGEKNHVVKKLYLMAAQNPDDEYWQIDAPPEIKTIDSRTGFVRSMVDPAYKHLPHVVMVRIGGRDQAIVFNEHNKEAVRLAQAMKNLDIDDLHVVLGLAAKGTRWFASVNTQYNPIFGLINFARDVQAGLLNLSTTELAGLEKAVASKIPTAMRAIYRERRGKVGANQTWTRLWDEFQDVGGTTGYRDMFTDAKERAKGLADELAAMDRGQASKAAHAVVDWLSDYNETMENAVRLAAYKVALDQGMTRERAASLAKNLTVNFNRKGRQAREIGALYAFFNAAIQGTVRMAETLKGPMGRRIMYGGVLLGAVNAMIGMAVMGGGDDDEPDRWEQVPEFIKERSIVIPLGRQDYLSIPLPLGFHVLPNMGRLAVEFALGDADKTAGRQLGKLLQVLADAFNPMGGSQNLGQMVAPTVIDPVVALMQNRDWTGKPIYRESNNPLDPQPGHKMAKDSASSPSRAIAEAINKVTGGTDYRPGAWSPTPDQLDYVIGQLTGGLGRELLKVNQTISATVTGDELPPYKVPLLGRLYGNTRGPAGQSEQFYENVKRLNEIENEIKGRYRNGQDAGAYRDSEPLSSLVPLANAMENQVRKLREIRRNLTERKPEGYQERVREVDQRIGQAMERLNAEVSKARK